MARKPVIEIEINDANFKAFAAMFDTFKARVEETPQDWQAFGTAMSEAVAKGLEMAGLVGIIEAVHDKIGGVADGTERAVGAQARLARATEHTSKVTDKLRDGARAVGSAFASAAKYLTVGGGLAALATGAGLFGLDRLAGSVTASRKSAGGLGLDQAEQAAFRLNYAPFVEPDTALSNVANARNSLDQQWIFSTLGLGKEAQSGESTTQLTIQLIDRVRAMVQNIPERMLGAFAQSKGIDQLFSIEDLRRMRREPAGQYGAAARGYAEDERLFHLSQQDQLAWRYFDRKLLESGLMIDRALIRGLTPLTGPLSHLSSAIADAISAFFDGKTVKSAIDKLAYWLDDPKIQKAIKDFGEYLGSDEFAKNVRSVFDAVGYAARKIGDILRFFGILPSDTNPVTSTIEKNEAQDGSVMSWLKRHLPAVFGAPDTADATPTTGSPTDPAFSGAGDARVAAIRDRLAKDLGIDPAAAGGFLSAPYAESHLTGILQHDANGNEIPGGDAGWGQWHGERRAAFMAWAKEHGLDWRSDAANMGFLESELRNNPELLDRLRHARTPEEAAAIGDEYERGHVGKPGDHFYNEHLAHARKFARLPSIPVPPVPTAPPPAPVPAVPSPTSDARPGTGEMSITLAAIRRAVSTAQQVAGRVQVSISNDTASRVAVQARGVAV